MSFDREEWINGETLGRNGKGEQRSPFVLAATHVCDVAAAFASGCTATGIILICVHDAKVCLHSVNEEVNKKYMINNSHFRVRSSCVRP